MRQTETTRLHDDAERTEFSDLAKSACAESPCACGAAEQAGLPFGLISVGVYGFAGSVSSVTRESDHPFAAIHSTKRLGEALHVNS